ncbi:MULTISPECIES: hypothetical protein [unclassified Herbaspirillum]|uniref:hypothetical protein n=1 Tax=unclassified Herbaspirillum TaxID=2624150 RepID=UPI00383A1213
MRRIASLSSLLFRFLFSPAATFPVSGNEASGVHPVNSLHRDGAQLSNGCRIEKKIIAVRIKLHPHTTRSASRHANIVRTLRIKSRENFHSEMKANFSF